MLDSLRLHVHVQSVLHDLSFKSPRYSRLEPGKVIGYADLTLIDWRSGYWAGLIFNARPDVAKAPGYRVLGANPRIVNPNGGVLDISWITPPSADQARAYGLKTGRALSFDTGARGGFAVREDGQLRLDTEIESGGTVKPLDELAGRDAGRRHRQIALRSAVSGLGSAKPRSFGSPSVARFSCSIPGPRSAPISLPCRRRRRKRGRRRRRSTNTK